MVKSQELIHQIGDLVMHSFKFPFVHYTVLNEDRFLDMLEELEISLPEELKQAQEVIANRDKILADAKRDAEETVSQAKLQARTLLSDSEILRQATTEAERIRQDLVAEQQKSQVGAERYADDTLAELEAKVTRALATVQNGRTQLNLS